ncbi:ABC transporter permease [Arthrobacter sp. KNU-44]|uniref:ABC transporter permease n=1 Tax=Arthrobacter sp. KNU-44 TaxID=3450744 RepID=UPI003F424756
MSSTKVTPPTAGDVTTRPTDARAIAEAPLWRRALTGSATWVLGLDIVLVLLFTLMSPNGVFMSLRNAQNLLLNGSEGLLLALATAVLLGAGLIDLSVGANLVLSSVIGSIVTVSVAGGHVSLVGSDNGGGNFTNVPLAILLGLVACIGTGVVYGLVNGLVITYLRVNSLIATLGTMSVGTGLTLLITKGSDIAGLPGDLQTGFGLSKIAGAIPLPAVVALGIAVLIGLLIRFTRFGLRTLAIGSSKLAADRAGIKVRRHTIQLTLLAGGLAGLAGFLSLAHFGSTSINGHVNDPLAAITAAVIGGAALTGGRISIVGTVWGTALAMILLSGLVVVGVSSFWQLVVIGMILIIAVAVDQLRNRRREDR